MCFPTMPTNGTRWNTTPARFDSGLETFDIDGTLFRVDLDFRYYSAIVGWVIVPKGFVTDFASIPRWATAIIPKNGKHDYAAVVHDYLYSTQRYSKEICDKVLLEACFVRNVPKWQAYTIYYAVKFGGKSSWNDDQIKYGLPVKRL